MQILRQVAHYSGEESAAAMLAHAVVAVWLETFDLFFLQLSRGLVSGLSKYRKE